MNEGVDRVCPEGFLNATGTDRLPATSGPNWAGHQYPSDKFVEDNRIKAGLGQRFGGVVPRCISTARNRVRTRLPLRMLESGARNLRPYKEIHSDSQREWRC
jgi:hypothetical protein